MSWQVTTIKNTLTCNFTHELIQRFEGELRLHGNFDDDWEPIDQMTALTYELNFNPDHAEWMDYLAYDEVRAILEEANAVGTVAFAKTDGDGGPAIWSYTFKPDSATVIVQKSLEELLELM